MMLYWDGALRGAAVALLVLLAWHFARDWGRGTTARLGVALALGGVCYVVLIGLPGEAMDAWWRVPFHLGSLVTPGLFWLFAQSWFDDDFRLRPWHGAVLALLMVGGASANYCPWMPPAPFNVFSVLWHGLGMLLVALGLWAALRGRDADLVEGRRRMRLLLVSAIGVVILWVVLSELSLDGWPAPVAWRVMNAASLLLLVAVLSAAMLAWRDPALLAAPPPAAEPAVVADDSALLARLDALMRRELLWRNEGVTMASVAAALGVPEYRLRRAINQGLGARNFNAWLNGYRLAEARAALSDPSQREVPILTIAMDAGFGSLAPFNRAFREAEGCTPSEFRARG
ncbi:AraC family transcriptional regulator [Sandaracinobacteroides saxicola]|uniref:Helix-turn-helix transcriptional regulator n=1 Tax=Sandaracinobacteroides saxicola TaxID=2759707 RepID=A0A7G5IGK0_9SPHN|nr:AraC family transcriptional regulator [Sandaracinobacteroides saxicola]QMW22492.1 helix-turn-helix transcriptional regulator [Sandaracinobacteroides saxicola]